MNTLEVQPRETPTNFMTTKYTSVNRYRVRVSKHHQLFISRIKSYGSLKDNWDSYGGIAPSESVIHRAVDCVIWLSENGVDIYFTAPSSHGDIVVEIKKGQFSIEFEFCDDGQDLIIQSENGNIREEAIYNHRTRTLFLNEFKDQHEFSL